MTNIVDGPGAAASMCSNALRTLEAALRIHQDSVGNLSNKRKAREACDDGDDDMLQKPRYIRIRGEEDNDWEAHKDRELEEEPQQAVYLQLMKNIRHVERACGCGELLDRRALPPPQPAAPVVHLVHSIESSPSPAAAPAAAATSVNAAIWARSGVGSACSTVKAAGYVPQVCVCVSTRRAACVRCLHCAWPA